VEDELGGEAILGKLLAEPLLYGLLTGLVADYGSVISRRGQSRVSERELTAGTNDVNWGCVSFPILPPLTRPLTEGGGHGDVECEAELKMHASVHEI
jgi:hypothetical protein